MIKKPIAKFNNGNNKITLYDDGTQIVKGDMNFEYPLTIDCKISSLCTMNCPYCYEGNNKDGKLADLDQEWINSLPPYTEIAINLNDPIDIVPIMEFLTKFKNKKIFANVTVNIKTFKVYKEILLKWQEKDLFKGIGISLTKEFLEDPEWYTGVFKKFKNLVIHTIYGVTTYREYQFLHKYYPEAKVLILGYKDKGRGITYNKDHLAEIEYNQCGIYVRLKDELFTWFDTLAFDCLAVKQLNIKDKVSKEDYDKYYLGDDGTRSMYIDMVNKKFAKSSLSEITYDLTDNIKEMFETIKKNRVIISEPVENLNNIKSEDIKWNV